MNHHIKHVTHTDIISDSFIDRFFPKKTIPYLKLARFDRPIGSWLLLFPAWWAICLSSGGWTQMPLDSWYMMGLSFIGAFVVRGAGCAINDLWDRKIDAEVERTRSRPLASGELSVKQALVFLFILLYIGAVVLLQLNDLSIIIGVSSIIPIALYPLMKRITFFPQVFLGITFGLSAVIGWTSIANDISISTLFLYIGTIFWIIGFDTIYGHQDIKDDQRIGIKSTALKFGKYSKLWVSIFYSISILCLIMARFILYSDFYLFLGLIPALHLFWQVKSWQVNNPADCLKKFKSNKQTAWLILLTLCF